MSSWATTELASAAFGDLRLTQRLIHLTTALATRDLGSRHAPRQHGLWVHSVLLAAPDAAPLGLLDQPIWARDPATVGISQQRRHRE